MASNIILKKSSVVSKVPVVGDLQFGELALNYADGKLYYKKADGTTIDSFQAGAFHLQPRVNASTANSATPELNTDNFDMMVITGQSVAITSFTTNLSGTPVNGQKLWISITGTTAIALTWGAKFESSTATLPTTTVSTNRLDVGFVWNVATNAWRCVAVA